MSSAEIAGIAVGAVAGVALLGAMFWYGKTHGWCAGGHIHDGYDSVN
jgi:hypothetical protein